MTSFRTQSFTCAKCEFAFNKDILASFSNMLSNGTYYISCWMTLAQIEAMKTKKVMFSDLQ